MKKIFLSMILFFTPLLSFAREEMVCITYYWGHSITSTGKAPKHLQTAAVDPKKIKYGSRIEIPALNKTLIANDTGPDVVSKRASKARGKSYLVVDIFVSSKASAKALQAKIPTFTKAIIHE
jgi:3D (Asp-Asp-Asp) domain-containing protein